MSARGGATRQPRTGGLEDLPVCETTTGDDDADVGGLRVVPLREPEVRLTPPQETSQRPNGAVERRTS